MDALLHGYGQLQWYKNSRKSGTLQSKTIYNVMFGLSKKNFTPKMPILQKSNTSVRIFNQAERERKRLEWKRQKQNYMPTYGSTKSNSSASSGNSSQGSIYICTFDCKGSDGTKHSISVSAPSNHKAQIQSENLETKQCRSMGFRDGIHSHWEQDLQIAEKK